MVFCKTNECDAVRGFLRTDDNRARSLVTIAVQRRAVDPSILKLIVATIAGLLGLNISRKHCRVRKSTVYLHKSSQFQ